MGLNIKNPRVHELAREAARVTGRSQTSAIEVALEQLLARHAADSDADRQRRIDRLLEVGHRYRETARALGHDRTSFDIDDLYDDDTGLPQ